MHLWFFFQTQLPSLRGNEHPADDTRNNPLKRLAIKRLKARIAHLRRRDRVERFVAHDTYKMVWRIEFAYARGGELYVDHRRFYTLSEDNTICPLKWSTMNSDEINFIALYL